MAVSRVTGDFGRPYPTGVYWAESIWTMPVVTTVTSFFIVFRNCETYGNRFRTVLPTVGVVGGFGFEGGDHFCMAYAVPTGLHAGPCSCIHGKVLHTAVLCVRMCTCCAYVYVYVCVLYLCVYVALCPFMFVFDGVFGFFW